MVPEVYGSSLTGEELNPGAAVNFSSPGAAPASPASASPSSSSSSSVSPTAPARLSPFDKDMLLADFKTSDHTDLNRILKGINISRQLKRKEEEIQFLEKAVRYGHFDSMVTLGQIYQQRSDYRTAYGWYTLAFEEHWLNTGQHHEAAKQQLNEAFLKNLLELLNRDQRKYFKNFNHHSKGYFSDFKNSTGNSLNKDSVVNLNKITKNIYNSYLNKEQAELRRLRFKAKINELNEIKEPWFDMAIEYFSSNNYKPSLICMICLERSKNPEALFNLGVFFAFGDAPFELPDNERYQKAAQYYAESGNAKALCNLGHLYLDGKIGLDLSEEERLLRAEVCFRKSGNEQSLTALAGLSYLGKIDLGLGEIERFKKAEAFFRQSGSLVGLMNLLLMHKHLSIELEDKEIVKITIQQKISHCSAPKRLFLLGLISYVDNNYAQAIIHLSQAVVLGNKDANHLLKLVEEIYHYENKLEELKKKEASDQTATVRNDKKENAVVVQGSIDQEKSTQATLVLADQESSSKKEEVSKVAESPVSSLSSSSDEQISSDSDEEEADDSSSPSSSSSSSSSSLKKTKLSTTEERMKRTERKLELAHEKAKKHSMNYMASSPREDSKETKTLEPLEISYLSSQIKKTFENVLGSSDEQLKLKIQTIFEDISEKTWATSGVGKPEVLKGKYRDYTGIFHKGCFSRRLIGGDRLVYKVLGPRQIQILGCEGHYEKR